MASNGNKVKAGVHAHEDKMHPGKPKTKMPPSVMRGNGNGNGNGNGKNKPNAKQSR